MFLMKNNITRWLYKLVMSYACTRETTFKLQLYTTHTNDHLLRINSRYT
jgi:hypothetical protein